MVGTSDGAKKARDTLLKKDPEFYSKIAAKAGRNTVGNFKRNPALAKRANLKSQEAKRKKKML